MSTITYPDSLLFPALMREIREAQSSIQIMTFIWKTDYAQPTRSNEFLDAVIAAHVQREVEVFSVSNYSRFEPDVAAENYSTAQKLADAGCAVRLGPLNQTLHTKLIIIDLERIFLGSHNLTRGALSFNREVTLFTDLRDIVKRMRRYYNQVWAWSTRFSDTPPPDPNATRVAIRLLTAAMAGQEIELGFSVNHTEGVDAFAAVSDEVLDLEGANMGETVAPTERVARVTPTVESGQTAYLAVRAYSQGNVEAESNIMSMTYQPTEPGGGDGEGGGGGDPPPPEPLTAPTLTSVVRATGDDVTATWSFAGCPNFHRFEIQRRDLGLIWVTLGTVMDETAREWTGAAANSTEDTPFRVVVFNMAEESAASNAVALAPLPVLTAPTLTTLYRVGAMGLHVDWTHAGVTDFARFELQQRQTDAVTWTAFATITDPTARTWEVDFVQYRDGTHPVRVVVFDTYGQSAASNEVFIGGPDAPLIESVETASGTTVRVQWTWSGLDFQSYIVQQQDAQQTWQDLAQLFAQTPMVWTGAPTAMQAGRPFRVVVNAGAPSPVAVNSNEVSLIAGPPPAPVLGVITPAPLPSVHVPWTWGGALNFQRFVIQQRDGAQVWQDLATITNPATIDWAGQMLMGGQAWPFRLVVHLTTGESATSAEGLVTQV